MFLFLFECIEMLTVQRNRCLLHFTREQNNRQHAPCNNGTKIDKNASLFLYFNRKIHEASNKEYEDIG